MNDEQQRSTGCLPVVLLALFACAAACSAEEYTAGSKLNARGDATAPLGRIGCIWLIGGQHNAAISNRQTWLLDPYATEGERTHGGKCRDWHELFARRVDPITNWLEQTPTPTLAIHDFERVWGNTGDSERFLAADEMLLSRAAGKPWLVDGFVENAGLYAASGRQVIAHFGCPDSASWAKGYIRQGTPAARGELLDALHEVYAPLVRRGVGVGFDNGSAQPVKSITWTKAEELRLMGAFVQIEATPSIDAKHWHGWPCRIVYTLFVDAHVAQKPWAVGPMPKFGTPEFAAMYPDIRVSIFPGHIPKQERLEGKDDERRAFLADVAKLSGPLVAGGCRVLLHEKICWEARRLGVPVSSFMGGAK